ncbi:MAG: hypothetical protein KDA69_07045 [Planctomycetaceae bacterium]|nr:hypothetical protein [Planctomycetaceae bacterium]
MWKVVDKSLAIMRQLYELLSAGMLQRNTASILELLERLETRNEAGTVSAVVPFLLSEDKVVRDAARRVTGNLLAPVPPFELRNLNSFWISQGWQSIRKRDINRLAGTESDSGHIEVLGILTFHHNGYVRHEALSQLIKCTGGRELPYLLIRQNDWVSPIAHDAQLAVLERINDSYVDRLFQSLRLILHLAVVQRRDHHEMVRRVIDLFLDESRNDLLGSLIESPDATIRRKVAEYGLEKSGSHQSRIITQGVRSDDHVVRLRCCINLNAVDDLTQRRELLDLLLKDRIMSIRREAFRILAEIEPDNATNTWKTALFDSSPSIRELGRYWLNKLGTELAVVAKTYRNRLQTSPESLAVIQGLAEVGEEADVPYFQQLLKHPFPTRRTAGIRGISGVRKQASISDVLHLLSDESTMVHREAGRAIRPYLHVIDKALLAEYAVTSSTFPARKHVCEVIAEFGKWKSIPMLLQIAETGEPETALVALDLIERWLTPPYCNKNFTQPSAQDRHDIKSRLIMSQGKVRPRTLLMIEQELRRFA